MSISLPGAQDEAPAQQGRAADHQRLHQRLDGAGGALCRALRHFGHVAADPQLRVHDEILFQIALEPIEVLLLEVESEDKFNGIQWKSMKFTFRSPKKDPPVELPSDVPAPLAGYAPLEAAGHCDREAVEKD